MGILSEMIKDCMRKENARDKNSVADLHPAC
jgi:hypothetical protein